jgi:uncharacterized protein YrrD
MLVKLHELQGYTLQAKDGLVGKIEDFYFDDECWVLRYVVVAVGAWLLHRHSVLIVPAAFSSLDQQHKIIHLELTLDRIASSPAADTTKPISRQYEERLARHYQWSAYWASPFGEVYDQEGIAYPGQPGTGTKKTAREEIKEHNPNDTHIRSIKAVTKYKADAADGELGQVEDFIVDNTTWKICYLQIGTGAWWSNRHVLLSAQLITDISWDNKSVSFKLNRQTIQAAPVYDPAWPITDTYEQQLARYYRSRDKS